MERKLILERLLDKYENSKHLLNPGVSNRRVMLRIDKKELPEYCYETAELRDCVNNVAQKLEQEGLIKLQWVTGRPVISSIVLNLCRIDEAYQAIDKIHPAQATTEICSLIQGALLGVRTQWIQAWRDSICHEIQQTLRIPPFGKRGHAYVSEFLRMLAYYDKLDGAAITTRAFSSACFQNSKRFEQEFQHEFLHAVMRFHPELAEICTQEELGTREKLAFLGIYAHPEGYPLSGNCSIIMKTGIVNFFPLFPNGVVLPSSVVDEVVSFDFQCVQKIIFIENMTNYNEYLRTEITPDELVIYHGGFFSPKKRQLMQKISESIPLDIEVYFWADIDLGGFQMFSRLQRLFPRLLPMRMSEKEVSCHAHLGLARENLYLERLQTALEQHEFPLFDDSIRMILQYGVTIEQEVFFI
jgi:hypothetical protein